MVDGREVEEEEEQDSAYQDWLCYFHASHFQQVSDLCMLICYMITCHHALTLSIGFVVFVRFEYSNSYMWLEFHNPPLDKDIALITDVSEPLLNLNLSISLYTQYLQRRLKYLAGNPFVAYPWTTWWIQLHEYASMSLYITKLKALIYSLSSC